MITRIKRVASVVLFALLALGCFSACSQEASSGSAYKDQLFLGDLARGLEARWDLAERHEGEATAESLGACVEAELRCVEDYANAQFEDTALRELAISYIETLQESARIASTYNSYDIEALISWNETYAQRTKTLRNIVELYDIPVSERYRKYLDDLVVDGRSAQIAEDSEAAVEGIASSINLVFEKTGYHVEGTAIVTNATEYSFESISFSVQLYDDAGVRTETSSIYVDNWASGEAVAVNVHVSSDEIPSKWVIQPGAYRIKA